MSIRFNLDDIFAETRPRRTDLAKARIFLAIAGVGSGKRQTRRTLTEGLSLRQATVSAMVGELIQSGLVRETEKSAPSGKGRPETSLAVRAERIMVPVIQVISRDIRGVLLDLNGNEVSETSVTLDEDAAEARLDEVLAS